MKLREKVIYILKKYNFFMMLMLTMAIAFASNPELFKIEKKCRIQINAVYDNDVTHGQEIWLTHVFVNQEEVPISSFKIEKNQNWTYAEDTDDFIFYSHEDATDNSLVLITEPKGDIELFFLKNSWSGTVKIATHNEDTVIDLYSANEGSEIYKTEENFTYSYRSNIIKWFEILVLAAIFVFLIKAILKKTPLIYRISFICCVFSFYILRNYDLLNGFMIVLLIACSLSSFFPGKYTYNMKLTGKKFSIIRCLLHFYFVFALIANRIFMTEALMTLGVREIGNFIVVALALFPLGNIVLYTLDRCRLGIEKREVEITNKQIRVVELTCFLIMFSILILMTLGFYPAIIPVDGVSHWTQAVSYKGWGIQDNTSAAFTILLRICYKIGRSPYCFIVLQLFLFSFILARLLTYFFTKGVSSYTVYCISALVAVLPNNYMTLLIVKTNPMYGVLCIWVTYLLIRLIDNPEKIGTDVRFIFEMSIALSCLYLCRHNSFLAVYGTFAVFIFMFIKYTKKYKKLKIKFIIPIFVTMALIKIVTGPVYTHFDVIPNTLKASSIGYPLVSPLAVAYNNDVELSEDVLEYMNRIRPLEYWSNHNRYHGDTFFWTEPYPKYDQTTQLERFKYYFKMLFSRPDIVIKDRLDSIESIWNIFPSKGQGAYNERYRLGISWNMPKTLLPANWNITEVNDSLSEYRHETAFTAIPYALCQLCQTNKILDSLVFRTGFSIVLVLYAIYYSGITGKKDKIMAIIPMFGTLITLVLVVSFQLYQYFWGIHITNWILIFYFILPTDRYKMKD